MVWLVKIGLLSLNVHLKYVGDIRAHTDIQTDRCTEPISIVLQNLVWLGENGIIEFKRPAKYVGYITAPDRQTGRQTDRCTEQISIALRKLGLSR